MSLKIFPEKWANRHTAILLISIGTIAALLYLDANEKMFRFLDSLAILATLFSLLLAAHHLLKMENTASVAVAAATKATSDMAFLARATEVSKVTKLIDEVKQCNRQKRKDVALIRLQDIRADLIFISSNETFKGMIDCDEFEKCVQEIGVLIHGIDKDIQRNEDSVDYVRANKRLDSMITLLVKVDSKIKQ